MNRTKIDWTDFSWNPIVGCLHHRSICAVGDACYARRIAKRFKHRCEKCYKFIPHMHEERLKDPYLLKKPSKIFVGSMTDMFSSFIPNEWIEAVIKVAEDNPQHIFQFLTKNPARYKEFSFPKNCWLGTTVNRNSEAERMFILSELKNIKFVSFEPLYEKINALPKVDWIIIGAQTNPPLQPKKEWVDDLIRKARKIGAKIFLKDNLDYPLKIREFP